MQQWLSINQSQCDCHMCICCSRSCILFKIGSTQQIGTKMNGYRRGVSSAGSKAAMHVEPRSHACFSGAQFRLDRDAWISTWCKHEYCIQSCAKIVLEQPAQGWLSEQVVVGALYHSAAGLQITFKHWRNKYCFGLLARAWKHFAEVKSHICGGRTNQRPSTSFPRWLRIQTLLSSNETPCCSCMNLFFKTLLHLQRVMPDQSTPILHTPHQASMLYISNNSHI